jgi:molybdopterin molybdotransferase
VASTAAAPEFLSFAEARERVMAAVRPLPPERVSLDDAVGRALRSEIRAPHALPPFANSAMDGVVVRAADLASASEQQPVSLDVVATIAAGHPAKRALQPGEAMRIMTGAPIPEGADTIVPVEDLNPPGPDAPRLRFTHPVPRGEHVRSAGADLTKDAPVFDAGRTLGPHDLALLASLGIAHVDAGPRPRVAILSTGDELLDVDAPLVPGAIRDSNTPLLRALVGEAGGTVAHVERLSDDPDHVFLAIERALANTDLVLTIGGVSAGTFDPVKLALERLDGIALWRVAMKPGRPQAFGVRGAMFHGLPGNPASVACVFDVLVRPALLAMAGHAVTGRPHLPVRTGEAIASREGRTDFIRVRLDHGEGGWIARPVGAQISGHLTPQAFAHGLLEVPEERASLAAGEPATVRLWRWPDPA